MNIHHNILGKARKQVQVNAILKGEKVYYECRKPPFPKQKFDSENRNNYYLGKLNGAHAECVSINPLSDYGLAAKIIGFKCNGKPSESALFQRRVMHKGSFGYLTERVICTILCQFQNISDK
ncbi:MAG TPA: hypothetical protein VJC37_02280 [Planctomycetota bacterium]|nr:hypothetical protein [Planctomycetota bacterium]